MVKLMNDLSFHFLSNYIAIVIPLLFIVLVLDDKGSRQIILFLCWGVFSGILAFNLNNYFGTGWTQADRLTLSIAPLVEEICKGLPVLLFLNKKKYPQITKQILFCAMASGIGFSIQESMFYFAISSREINDIAVLIIRSCTTALMHGMTTAVIGAGIMLLRKYKELLIPVIFGLFALSASIHALYNLLLQTYFAFIALLMPVTMLLAGWWFVRNEYIDKDL